jgi:hypothetical protein
MSICDLYIFLGFLRFPLQSSKFFFYKNALSDKHALWYNRRGPAVLSLGENVQTIWKWKP